MRMIFRCDPALSDHLPRPLPARAALPDWLRAMPATAHSDIFTSPRNLPGRHSQVEGRPR
jgi:hypothetical protein